MVDSDLSSVRENLPAVMNEIGRESVDVYLFLSDEFARGSVTENFVFQFVYRSFYRLDNAGLTDGFKQKYFNLMEAARKSNAVEVRSLAQQLLCEPNIKGQDSLQFSFVTKLANTVNSEYPIYDSYVAGFFRFRPPTGKSPEDRLEKLLPFYEYLRTTYREILAGEMLRDALELFGQTYSARVAPVKMLDFIFWSAARRGLAIGPSGVYKPPAPAKTWHRATLLRQ